ncbi:MAG: hypothetical protein ACQERD_06745 [Campylobacterota bacterium]
MKEFLENYKLHKDDIEFYLQESIRNIGDLSSCKKDNFKELFNIFPSLELVYFTNKETKIQNSPNYYKSRVDKSAFGKDRSAIISKLEFKENNMAFSTPYISSATRNNCITVTIKDQDEIIFFDFRLDMLLEKLSIIELNKPFHSLTKGFYIFSGFTMILLSIITIVFSLYDFVYYLFVKTEISIEVMFKPIIALTLGIAIFDLAKTILEQEVFFKSYSKNSKVETKLLVKFLSTIIIALSIEALIVVFKIAINDYADMINAFYLIAGIALILISLTFFVYFSNKRSNK